MIDPAKILALPEKERDLDTTCSRPNHISLDVLWGVLVHHNAKMRAMDYKAMEVIPSQYLSSNSVIISMDLAKKMEEAGIIKFSKQPKEEGE